MRFTVQNVLTDDTIERIATNVLELIKRDTTASCYIESLKKELKSIEKKIDNVLAAIEQGVVTSSTKERLEQLEQEKNSVEKQIGHEELKKPCLTKEHIIYWLSSFRNGDIDDIEYQRRIIDTLVNSVYVYDNGEKGRKILITFNLSGQNTVTLSSSDIAHFAPPNSHSHYM